MHKNAFKGTKIDQFLVDNYKKIQTLLTTICLYFPITFLYFCNVIFYTC